MATVFIPMIDYESFRSVLNRDLPDAYDKWLHLAAKMSEDNRSKGGISKLVRVGTILQAGEATRSQNDLKPAAAQH